MQYLTEALVRYLGIEFGTDELDISGIHGKSKEKSSEQKASGADMILKLKNVSCVHTSCNSYRKKHR